MRSLHQQRSFCRYLTQKNSPRHDNKSHSRTPGENRKKRQQGGGARRHGKPTETLHEKATATHAWYVCATLSKRDAREGNTGCIVRATRITERPFCQQSVVFRLAGGKTAKDSPKENSKVCMLADEQPLAHGYLRTRGPQCTSPPAALKSSKARKYTAHSTHTTIRGSHSGEGKRQRAKGEARRPAWRPTRRT